MLKQSVKVSINGNANKFISKLNTVGIQSFVINSL